MRICAIGPSHLAALRTADQNGLFDTSGHEIDYMGHVWWVFGKIRLDGKRLFFDMNPPIRPLAPDLSTEVTVTDYDALLVHGVVAPATRIMEASGARRGTYSESMRRKVVERALKRGRAFDCLAEIPKVFDGPVIVSPRPEKAVPSGAVVEDTGKGDVDDINRLLSQVLSEMGIAYLPQPIKTVLNGRYTRREYSEGSLRLGERGGHKDEDVLHMNEKYGALVFNRALRLLTELKAVENSGARAV